jgi:hypothetical protein
MRLHHSAIRVALLITGVLVLGLATRGEATAASDCPCVRGNGGICIPDRACEARQRQMRDRLRYRYREYPTEAAPRNGTMRYQHGWARPTVAAPAPTIAPAPAAPVQRESAQKGYRRAPAAAPAPPPPVPLQQAGRAPVNVPTGPIDIPVHTTRARPPAADTGPAATTAHSASASGRLRILETGYSHLSELGKEEEGYGLYSYAILPSESSRAATFLSRLFKEIPSIGETGAQRSQLNVFYVPLKKDRESDFATLIQASGANADRLGAEYSKSFYDYRIARALLNHVCNPPADSVRQLCEGDLSRGPYIFTYASPASSMDSVPPPFLFVDLSNVHEQAFGELIAAFRSQVKREDISDQARIRTLRLTILEIALTAADWVNPVQKAIAEIVHAPSADDKK